MIIKIDRADGQTEMFENGNYLITNVKDFHPIICKITIYGEGKKIKTVKRPFSFIYKHFTFKSKKVQEQLKNLANQAKTEDKTMNTEVMKNEG